MYTGAVGDHALQDKPSGIAELWFGEIGVFSPQRCCLGMSAFVKNSIHPPAVFPLPRWEWRCEMPSYQRRARCSLLHWNNRKEKSPFQCRYTANGIGSGPAGPGEWNLYKKDANQMRTEAALPHASRTGDGNGNGAKPVVANVPAWCACGLRLSLTEAKVGRCGECQDRLKQPPRKKMRPIIIVAA